MAERSVPPWRWRIGRRPYPVAPVGGLPNAPTEIPLIWLSQPLPMRLDQPVNTATITRPGTVYADGSQGPTGFAEDLTSYDEYGAFPGYEANLTSLTEGDPAALAAHTVAYLSEARTRVVQATIDLLYRTDAERLLILRVERGQRIRLTGVPVEFPEGADSLIVAGIAHETGVQRRRITWTFNAVVGSTPGVPGPWFRLDSSVLDGPDLMPF